MNCFRYTPTQNIYSSPLYRFIPLVSPPPPMPIYIPLGPTGLPYRTPEYKPPYHGCTNCQCHR
jgi:hypothetical protein